MAFDIEAAMAKVLADHERWKGTTVSIPGDLAERLWGYASLAVLHHQAQAQDEDKPTYFREKSLAKAVVARDDAQVIWDLLHS